MRLFAKYWSEGEESVASEETERRKPYESLCLQPVIAAEAWQAEQSILFTCERLNGRVVNEIERAAFLTEAIEDLGLGVLR
jgi:hypothetical protein